MTNTNINIFEEASKRKFRYPYKGFITTEDLWDLNMAQLDSIFRVLNKEVADKRQVSLLANMEEADAEVLTKIEIVKYIFKVKEKEIDDSNKARENAAQRQLILGALARKREDAIANMSEEELLAKLDELG